jgi:hypothetical protein
MVDYLVDLVTPPPGTVCPSDHQPFDPDFLLQGGSSGAASAGSPLARKAAPR